MKVFISGPMRNKPNSNKEAFFEAEYKLKRLGYSVFNPAWCQYGVVTEFTADDMHAVDFAALERCDAIYMLKGWQYSIGARAEYEHAKALGKEILIAGHPVKDPLRWDKEPEKNTPVFDREFAYDEAIKNRTNYQLEAIKENVKEKYAELKSITRNLDISLGNESDRINSLEGEVEAIKESIGTDDLQEQLEKDFDDVYTEFSGVKDKVNDVEFGYIDWSSKMSSAIEEMEKVRDTVNGLNSIVGELGRRSDVASEDLSIWIKNTDALHRRINKLEAKLSSFLEGYNSTLTRLKAIEKRLSIKPFYAPTEDEKDD